MKHWPSQAFPIILLAFLAGLSFWLQKSVDRNELPAPAEVRHTPDAIAENFSARRFDENGQIKFRLVAPYMEHFPDDDSSELRAPTLIAYRPDTPPVTISGRNAKVTAKGEVVYLWGDVVVNRAASPERPALTAIMPDLVVHPNESTAFTNSAVEITQGKSWIKGVGMKIDNEASTFELQSQVTGLYYSSKAPQ
ncbi:MAG: LPS export ABC transporter periplasmic protein LptC [Rhodocyclaceae bacterium]|nr:LPS export ABC transporter periplasmic protein LptC [Rhodocyclaceae bacterium]